MKAIIIYCLLAVSVLSISSCQKEEVKGCTNPNALNYNSQATQDDGSCIAKVYGCTNRTSSNYNPAANVDDGSCILKGGVFVWTYVTNNVTVTINGQSATIAQATPQPYNPNSFASFECDGGLTSQYVASFVLDDGTYNLTALGPGGSPSWSTSVTVTGTNCLLQQLN
jgi:hypothetical protein